MEKKEKKHFQMPFHIVKRAAISLKTSILIYAVCIVSGLLLSALICAAFSGKSPIDFMKYLFTGNFGSSRRLWLWLKETALLLGVSLALVPAFKMKFWNLGGNGQVLVSCLATIAVMKFLGGVLPDVLIYLLMIIAGVGAAVIWAVIPAIFKAFFNTNESLFTLMMNYIASGLVSLFITIWVKSGSGTLGQITEGNLPKIYNDYLLTVAVFFLLGVLMYVYLKYSKHGYELTVVGESTNTAKYVGINVKKVIIRTMILSGAIAGLVGVMKAGALDYTVGTNSAENMGFTAIMSTWLANFNPFVMMITSGFIAFIKRGMTEVNTKFKFTDNAISNFVIGIIYFSVIVCTFFINYKIVFDGKKGEKKC